MPLWALRSIQELKVKNIRDFFSGLEEGDIGHKTQGWAPDCLAGIPTGAFSRNESTRVECTWTTQAESFWVQPTIKEYLQCIGK